LRSPLSALCIVCLLLFAASWTAGACLSGPRLDAVAVPGSPSTALSSEWPKFRHDLSNSGVTDSPVSASPHLVWQKDLGGMVTSSASIVNGILYVGVWETSGVPGKLVARNLTTGSPVWTYIAGANGIPSSPAVDGGIVYFGTRNDNIVALDALSGAEKWNISTGGAVYSSPAVVGGTAFVACLDGKVYARDAVNGGKKWETGLFASSESSPAAASGKVYLGDESGYVYALYQSNGSTAWTYDTKGGYISSSPAYDGTNIYITNSKQMIVYALNANSGGKAWSKNISGGLAVTAVKASAAVHNGKVFVGTKSGTMWALNSTDGSIAWSKPGFTSISSSATVSDGRVVFGAEDGFIYVLNETDGSVFWKYETKAVMVSSPTVYNGYIVTGGNDHVLYALGIDATPPTVQTTAPKSGATAVPVDADIWIQFSEEMKTGSLIGAVTINPPVSFNLTWDPAKTTVTLARNETLKPNTQYTVKVLGTVTDAGGNPMGGDYQFQFTTQDVVPPKVLSTKPADKEENVSKSTTVRVQFSKRMHHNSTESAFSTSPVVPGTYTWDLSDMNLTFTPSKSLDGDRWYTVTISGNAQDYIGNKMSAQYKFSFHTFDDVGPTVVSTSPKNAETNVKVATPILITFSEAPDATSAKDGFSISPGITISSKTVSGSTLTVSHTGLQGDTKYTVMVTGVKDPKGNPGTAHSFWFRTTDATAPYVKSYTPASSATGVKVGTVITIVFSEEMDKASVESAVTIYPAVGFMTKWDNASPTLTIIPGAILTECTKYIVNISTGAKDISGNALVTRFSLGFTTEGQCANGHVDNGENPIVALVFKYWWLMLLIFIIIMVIAVAIPSRRTLQAYYGLDDEDLKKGKQR